MFFTVKSRIIFNGTVYESGELIDLPEGSETRDLFLNKIERVDTPMVNVVENTDEDYVLEGTDDTPVVEIQANFTPNKNKKGKKK